MSEDLDMDARKPLVTKEQACRSCGARIFWAVTPAGKRAPIDLSPTEDGNVSVWQRSDGSLLARPYDEKAAAAGARRYVNHFATCPDRRDWRKE